MTHILRILALVVLPVPLSAVEFEFDYRYDSADFFIEPERRAALETAGRLLNLYVDDLAPITPGGANSWSTFLQKPGGDRVLLSNLSIGEDSIVVFVGGDNNLNGRLASAFETIPTAVGTKEFVDSVVDRNSSDAGAEVDFAPAIGSITFNNDPNEVSWYFQEDPQFISANEYDFITVAMHELGHLMGIGTSQSFETLSGSGSFEGSDAVATGSSTNRGLHLDSTGTHFETNTKSSWNGITQESLFARTIEPGQRQFPTRLDRAVLRDIGWEEAQPGDANLDRILDDDDLHLLLQGGKYESGKLAGWSEGDFNRDGLFTSMDLLNALSTRANKVAVPMSTEFDAISQLLTVNLNEGVAALQISGPSSAVSLGMRSAPEPPGAFDLLTPERAFIYSPSGIQGPIQFALSGNATIPFSLQLVGATLAGHQFSTSFTVVPEATPSPLLLGILLVFMTRKPRPRRPVN